MRNLAGDPRADSYVKRALRRAKIVMWEHDKPLPGEVRTRIDGELRHGDTFAFHFERKADHWRATGLINWDMVRELPHLHDVEVGLLPDRHRPIEYQPITFFIHSDAGLVHFVEALRTSRCVNAEDSDNPLPQEEEKAS